MNWVFLHQACLWRDQESGAFATSQIPIAARKDQEGRNGNILLLYQKQITDCKIRRCSKRMCGYLFHMNT